MFKKFILAIALVLPVMAMSMGKNMVINFQKDISPDTIKLFYSFAVDEYEYANYGFSKDLFQEIANKSSDFPGTSFYLAKIYSEVPMFRNIVLAKQYYLKVTIDKGVTKNQLQETYLALAGLTNNSDLQLEYAKKAFFIQKDENSQRSLIAAYQKKYDQTQESRYMTGANIVMKSLDKPSDVRFNNAVKTTNTGFRVE